MPKKYEGTFLNVRNDYAALIGGLEGKSQEGWEIEFAFPIGAKGDVFVLLSKPGKIEMKPVINRNKNEQAIKEIEDAKVVGAKTGDAVGELGKEPPGGKVGDSGPLAPDVDGDSDGGGGGSGPGDLRTGEPE